jgi:hypothetical protein
MFDVGIRFTADPLFPCVGYLFGFICMKTKFQSRFRVAAWIKSIRFLPPLWSVCNFTFNCKLRRQFLTSECTEETSFVRDLTFWTWPPSGTWRRVVCVWTDLSEERNHLHMQPPDARWFLARLLSFLKMEVIRSSELWESRTDYTALYSRKWLH